MRQGIAIRIGSALAVLLLAAGTVLATDPSSSPDPSTEAGPGVEAASPEASPSPSPSPETTEPSPSPSPEPSAQPSESPESSESPDASEAPEKPDKPEADETPGTPPSDAEVADFVARLHAAGINTTAAAFKDLAANVGVGGAVRVLMFADASGKTPAQILAMRQDGMGWGQMVHALNLNINPGIGWIMRGGHSAP